MNQKDNFENEGVAELLADLPLTDAQAEETKGGPETVTPSSGATTLSFSWYLAHGTNG